MLNQNRGETWRWAVPLLMVLSLFASLSLGTTYANNVQINDDAGMLGNNLNSVKSRASSLPFNVRIRLTKSFTDKTAFINKINEDANSLGQGLMIGVSNSASVHTTWVVANNIGIDSSESTTIASTADSYFKNSDFAGGVNAMLNRASSLASVPSNNNNNNNTGSSRVPAPSSRSNPSSGGGGFGGIIGCLVIGLIVIVAISVFGAGRRRGSTGNGPGYGGNNNNYNNNPGYGGPGYGGGYGPGYGNNNNGGGIGAVGGGVIGAGLGGVAGYEIGKAVGRSEGGNNGGYNNGGGGNSWSGSNSGGSADFGSGGSDWGGSSGGDSGGSSWGGGDSGGSSGSSDFGSSSSFDAGGGGGGDSW